MKKWLVYVLGIVTGIVLTILVLFAIVSFNERHPNSIPGLSFFDEPNEVIGGREYKVFQALSEYAALATDQDFRSDNFGIVVLLWDDTGEYSYYDGQDVTTPKGKCFRQVGTYKYETTGKFYKIVPIMTLMDGESDLEVKENNYGEENIGTDDRFTFLDTPGEIMEDNSYKVSRVLKKGAAIARGKSEYGSSYYGLEVVLWDEEADYYDDQIVKAPKGKCFRRIGTFKGRYGSSTLPIVAITDK